MTLLRTQHLTKVYRTDTVETTALNDVDITIEQGEFVAIIGRVRFAASPPRKSAVP